ncbi:hypothetical protein INT48_006784 [Thamnidium elegans]|uniref:Homeobox domain-containing protein n=1 Tax=Thamnidium elegans TaxID=101142 RepID=A0A8H7SPU5_9FUNG|nr:hypothetical protein INT48_006784 [Thamnidium elegans]
MTTQTTEKQKLRTFSPVILFHDHQYVKAGSGDLQHVHIPYGDPSYGRHLDLHKKRIHEMLQTNGKYWLDIITWTRDHPEPLDHSPVPSLVSSPSPPHYHQLHEEARFTKHMDTKKVVSSNKRRRGNLPKAVTAILRDWLSRHKKHPYPTEEEKASLATETNLNLNQISNWFINARRRILQPMLEQEEEEKNELDIIMPYDNRHHLDDVYHDRRLRKRSATDVLAPTKYPPQKRMTHNRRR